jgi:hypothetical protein
MGRGGRARRAASEGASDRLSSRVKPIPPATDAKRTIELRARRFLRLGLLCVIAAMVVVIETRFIARSSIETAGVVVYDGRAELPHRDRIRVRFTMGDSVIQFEEKPGLLSRLHVGDTVSVLYPPGDPGHAHVNESPVAIALIPLAAGIAFLIVGRRIRRRAA